MKNRRKFKEISRLRTSDLMILKMDCIEEIALFRSFKLGLIGFIGVFVGQVVKTIYANQGMLLADYISAVFAFLCIVYYLVFNLLEARSTSQKELICDLLALRMNKTGKSLDKGIQELSNKR